MLRPVRSHVEPRSQAIGAELARGLLRERKPSWSLRQMRIGRVYRAIRLYNWLIGISGAFALLCAKVLGSQLSASLVSRDVVFGAFSLLTQYIHGLVVANLVLVGAVMVRGPLSADLLPLLQALAQRYNSNGSDAVELGYSQGAVLTARVALVAPAIMLVSLIAMERRPSHLGALLMSVLVTLLAIAALGATAGLVAVYMRRTIRKRAILAWFGLWLVPELVCAIVPAAPTPRSTIYQVLRISSFDGEAH
jgi:hypothetical protein